MRHNVAGEQSFPLTLTLSLGERSPRTLIAPCAHEPVFEHSFISNNLRVRFMGREQQASGWCVTNGCWANSGTGVIERLWTILPLPRGEGRGEGEPRVAHLTVPLAHHGELAVPTASLNEPRPDSSSRCCSPLTISFTTPGPS